jgi:hypothetical protein
MVLVGVFAFIGSAASFKQMQNCFFLFIVFLLFIQNYNSLFNLGTEKVFLVGLWILPVWAKWWFFKNLSFKNLVIFFFCQVITVVESSLFIRVTGMGQCRAKK